MTKRPVIFDHAIGMWSDARGRYHSTRAEAVEACRPFRPRQRPERRPGPVVDITVEYQAPANPESAGPVSQFPSVAPLRVISTGGLSKHCDTE